MKVIPGKHCHELIDAIHNALDKPAAVKETRKMLEHKGLSKAIDMFDRHHDSLHSFAAFPKEHWRRLRTTNMMERMNMELKRRTKKIGAFPNDASLLRLTVSLLMDIDEEWITGRRYLSMEAMTERREGYTV